MRYIALLLAMFGIPARAAYYAEIDQQAVVIRVVVVSDSIEIGPMPNPEANGVAWCQEFFSGGIWIKTFQDGTRKHYSGPGYSYHADIDAFIAPQPYQSWTLDPISADWVPPVPRPDDGHNYLWDEENKTWVQYP